MAKPQLNVLFICSGNICRSPYAAALLSRELAGLGIDSDSVKVESAGTLDLGGRGASRLAHQLAAERGLDLSQHLSRQVDKGMLYHADIVVAMTPSHAVYLAELSRDALRKTVVWDIPDPYGLTERSYGIAFAQIDQAMVPLINEIKKKIAMEEIA